MNTYPTLYVQDGFINSSTSTLHTTNMMPAAWELQGQFRADEIMHALATLVGRHDALRTSVAKTRSGQYQQRVHPNIDAGQSVDVLDLRGRNVETTLSWLMGQHLTDPFHLRRPPLWRGFLCHTADDHWVLGICFAHVMCDGACAAVVARELAAALGNTPQPAIKQIGELAVAERRIKPTGDQIGFWKGEYALRRGLQATWKGTHAFLRVHPVAITAEQSQALQAIATVQGASISTTYGVLTALAGSRVLGVRPMLGFATAQRYPGNHDTFGPLFDHLPVFADTDKDLPVSQLLSDLHQKRAEARAHRLPAEMLADIANNTAYDIAVNYSPFGVPVPQTIAGGRHTVQARPISTIGHVDVYRATSVVPAAAGVFRPQQDGAVIGSILGVSRIITAMDVRLVALAFEDIVAAIIANPHASVTRIRTASALNY